MNSILDSSHLATVTFPPNIVSDDTRFGTPLAYRGIFPWLLPLPVSCVAVDLSQRNVVTRVPSPFVTKSVFDNHKRRGLRSKDFQIGKGFEKLRIRFGLDRNITNQANVDLPDSETSSDTERSREFQDRTLRQRIGIGCTQDLPLGQRCRKSWRCSHSHLRPPI